MNTNPKARVSAGTPAGGQFAAQQHDESPVRLGPPSDASPVTERPEIKAVASRLAELGAARSRLQRQVEELYAREDRLGRIAIAAELSARYPEAAVLELEDNQDGENQLDPLRLLAVDGTVLADVRDDAEWVMEPIGDGRQDLQSLCYSLLDPKNPANRSISIRVELEGAEQAVAEDAVHHHGADNALTDAEHHALVDGAHDGLEYLNDLLEERADDYEDDDLETITQRRDELRRILGY